MLKALVPVDGSSNSLCAVRHVIKLVQDREPLNIHLLNVQPPFRGDVTSFGTAGRRAQAAASATAATSQ